MSEQRDPNVCCPKFDPKPWDKKTLVWKNKPFIRGTVPQLFHMPWPPMIGKLLTKLWNQAESAGAATAMEDYLCLSTDPSPWKSEFYLLVKKPVNGADNVKMSGTFITQVFDGPFSHIPMWVKDMNAYVESKGKKAKNYYFYFTTCPKCAKKYGHNYIVGFTEVE